MKTNSYAKNTAILFVSMIISKVVGALFKIPLTNILGGIGMGYYSTAYSIYSPVFAMTAAAIPTVIIKTVADNVALKKYANAEKVLKTALAVFGTIGGVGTALIILFAKPFSDIAAQSPQSLLSILMISPSVCLCCVSSVLKGYYEGCCTMVPSAVSQVLESVSRAIIGLSASYFIINYGMEQYSLNGIIMGKEVANEIQALDTVLPYAAAGAIMAVTMSELCALICLVIRKKFSRRIININIGNKETEKKRVIAKRLIKDCIPVAAAAIVVNLASFIDLITIPRCLNFALSENPAYFMEKFSGIIITQGGEVKLANFMYGSYTGLAWTMFMLIPAFTAMFGRSALPQIAAAWSLGNKNEFKNKVSIVLISNFAIGFPLYLGISALSGEILNVLFSGRQQEVSISVVPLFILGLGGVFLTLTSTFISVFQVIGRADLPVKIMLPGCAVKLIVNVFSLSMPEINISGAAISTVAMYAFTALGGYFALETVTGIDFKVLKKMTAPLISGIICAYTAFIVNDLLKNDLSDIQRLAVSIISGGIVYVLFMAVLCRNQIKLILKKQIAEKF
ncbi:MAG: polysaccharide biosynthesis C-terminal domain-containing protein [Ruminiclostridium sp.]